MATYLVTTDSPSLRQAMLGSQWNALPTGKVIDELRSEVGETVPTQAKAFSSCSVVSNGAEPVLLFNVGQSAANEYLIAVPRSKLKLLTMKLTNA